MTGMLWTPRTSLSTKAASVPLGWETPPIVTMAVNVIVSANCGRVSASDILFPLYSLVRPKQVSPLFT
jgi:hypothetical protein